MEILYNDFDWSSIDLHFDGEPTAKKGLRKRRQELEKIVAPYVSRTATHTGHSLLFKGRRQYLKPLLKKNYTLNEYRYIGYSIRALQFIYHAESAWKTGDIDKAIRMSIGFSECHIRVAAQDQWGLDIIDCLTAIKGLREGNAKGGKASAKWKPEYEKLARKIFSEQKRAKVSDDRAYIRTAAKLNSEYGVELSKDTVKRRLSKPPAQQ